MRALVALAVLVALAPTVSADDVCDTQRAAVAHDEGVHLGASLEERACASGISSREVAVTDPDGRTVVEWYDDERGAGVTLTRAPRMMAWTDDERGCAIVVYVSGPVELPCAAGAPPPPP